MLANSSDINSFIDETYNETWSGDYSEFSLPPFVRFWLLIIFEIPSLACSLTLLYYLIIDRTLRKALNNHVIVVLLIVGLFDQLVDIPFYLNYIRLGYVWPQIPITCLFWWFAATGISNITNILMAWASIERHILVFHSRWFLTKQKRFLFHYLPLFLIIFYGFIYYIIILSIFSCENMYAYTQDWCLYPCYYDNEDLALYDTIVNSIIPTPVIVFFSITLILRVIKQKQNFRRNFEWRKYRRMIRQLVSVSSLVLFFNLPMTCFVLAHVCDLLPDEAGQFEYYTYFFYHYVSLLMPFVCLISLAEIKMKIKRMFIFRKPINVIQPRAIIGNQ